MLKYVAILVIAMLVAIPTVGGLLAQRCVPTVDGMVSMPQLYRSVIIKYDERSIPYIEADSEHDMYFAQGYATACQRMFQMDLLRRTALGELSGLLGNGALTQDKLARTVGFNRLARSEWKRLSKDARRNLDAYSDGINAYLSEYSKRTGLEFLLLGEEPKRWEPIDSLAILKYKQYEMEESWRLDDLRQRVVEHAGEQIAQNLFNQSFQKRAVSYAAPLPGVQTNSSLSPEVAQKNAVSYAAPFSDLKLKSLWRQTQPSLPIWGSNGWVIGSNLTDTKGSMLACDKHSLFQSPNEWFVCSLSGHGEHFAGATIPGVPGVISGRNKEIAWAGVALKADTQDLYIEQFSPQFPGKYRTATGWETAEEINEVIPVRFANSIQYKVLSTKHGPLLLRDANTGVAFRWSGADQYKPLLETIFEIDRAKNWQEFTKALSQYAGPAQTFCYADRNNNIGYHGAGNTPVRGTGAGSQLNQGWDQNAEWRGRAAFASLPHAYNPGQNFAVADDPLAFSLYNLSNPLRAIRISGVLASLKQSGHKIGLPDLAALQGDDVAPLAALFKKELTAALNRTETVDRYQLTALEALKKWDGSMGPESVGATIYESFLQTVTRRLLEPKLGREMTDEYRQLWPRWSVFVQTVLTEKPKEWLPPEERTYETFMLTTFSSAIKNIRVGLRTDDVSKWQWQNLHQINFENRIGESNSFLSPIFSNVFKIGPLGVGGDEDTINACNVVAAQVPWAFQSSSGPTLRLLIDMSDSDKFYESIPLGESGHLLSSNRSDQTKAWLTNAPHAVAFSSEQLDKQMQHKLILSND